MTLDRVGPRPVLGELGEGVSRDPVDAVVAAEKYLHAVGN
jgi:hypothetical protein